VKPQNRSRRTFLATVAAAPFLARFATREHIPVGLELYSVRDELQKDTLGTVRQVARMGYECVEFYAPYYDWTVEYARQVRKELDELGVRCYSTHNDRTFLSVDRIGKAIELNQVLGARYVVLADAGKVADLDGWREVAHVLNEASQRMSQQGLRAGYHNHEVEWKPVGGKRPIEILAASTEKSIVLQLDVGTCLAAGSDPVAWIDANPGRIRSMHCKDWSPEKGYRVLFGEGIAPWKRLFSAAETTGGIEYYLMEQEGSAHSEMETARRCLVAYRNSHTTSSL
jgi:sugar phosphate isomerase/epimerase